jgi:hypothetical protein
MNLRISLLLLFLVVSKSLFSQKIEFPIVSYIDGDSVIIFTTEQGRKLVNINEQKKECSENLYISVQELKQQKVIAESQKIQLENLQKVISDKDTIIESNKSLNAICEDEKKILKKEVRKQKIAKWVSVGGIVVVGILGIVF